MRCSTGWSPKWFSLRMSANESSFYESLSKLPHSMYTSYNIAFIDLNLYSKMKERCTQNLSQDELIDEVYIVARYVHLFLFIFSCKEFQNLHSFFAIVMGLSNIAVSRLSQTWEVIGYFPNSQKY